MFYFCFLFILFALLYTRFCALFALHTFCIFAFLHLFGVCILHTLWFGEHFIFILPRHLHFAHDTYTGTWFAPSPTGLGGMFLLLHPQSVIFSFSPHSFLSISFFFLHLRRHTHAFLPCMFCLLLRYCYRACQFATLLQPLFPGSAVLLLFGTFWFLRTLY